MTEHVIVSAAAQFRDKTSFVHQMWQTDFACLKIIGWGWYYLSTMELGKPSDWR